MTSAIVRGAVLAVAAALVLAVSSACAPSEPAGPRVSARTRLSDTPRLAVVHGKAPRYSVSLEIPGVELPAGSSQTATATITNTSDAVLELMPPVGMRIFDESDRLVYTTPRDRARHPNVSLRLEPQQRKGFTLEFVVPPPGLYVILAFSSDGTETPATSFASVAKAE